MLTKTKHKEERKINIKQIKKTRTTAKTYPMNINRVHKNNEKKKPKTKTHK